jgi:hypothetical protein
MPGHSEDTLEVIELLSNAKGWRAIVPGYVFVLPELGVILFTNYLSYPSAAIFVGDELVAWSNGRVAAYYKKKGLPDPLSELNLKLAISLAGRTKKKVNEAMLANLRTSLLIHRRRLR